MIMYKSFEIYFNDLNAEAQKRYLEFQGVSDESELNHEICPLGTVDLEIEEPVCKKCGSHLDEKGHCSDVTCPYSDRLQTETFTEG